MGTVLLAPGFTGSKEDFLELLPLLREIGWTVVAVDHRGQFESAPGHDYGLDVWAADLVALARGLEPPVHLVGHSLGGMIAGRAAAMFEWATVTLLNSGSGPVHQSQHDKLRLLLTALEHLSMEQIWEAKAAHDRANGWTPPNAEVEGFMRERFVRTDPAGMAAMARILLEGPTQDFSGVAADLLVAFGIRDPDSWSWQTQVDLAARWRARLALIPNAAHSPAVEAPETTTSMLAAFMLRPGDHQCVRPQGCGYAHGMRLLTPLPSDTVAIRRARKVVSDQLWAWGLRRIADDAELVTSELVTNAIAHGGSLLELRLSALPGRVRVGVLDTNTADLPVHGGDRGLQSGGRGLILVQAVADDWGVDVADDHKEVWAELRV
jgi:pimeloyl-ACP methyl ester carboxylesterase/anti-sigma regulatory factor (Ser/Thr protein kinase)